MPLLRITCPPSSTERFVAVLFDRADAREVSVLPGASRPSGGDLILADVPRYVLDVVTTELGSHLETLDGVVISIEPTERLSPVVDDDDGDAVVWAQVEHEVGALGHLSWINTLLIVSASMIAAIGLIEDQLLLLVGAMALSPDYYPIAMTCLALVDRSWERAVEGLRTVVVVFGVGALGAFALTELLTQLGMVSAATAPSPRMTMFVFQPDSLSVVVAVIAGIAGALAVTLPDARGLVGVLVSITTIPAAADIGVAVAAGDRTRLVGSAVQLGANVAGLLIAGTATLALRRTFRSHLGPMLGRR